MDNVIGSEVTEENVVALIKKLRDFEREKMLAKDENKGKSREEIDREIEHKYIHGYCSQLTYFLNYFFKFASNEECRGKFRVIGFSWPKGMSNDPEINHHQCFARSNGSKLNLDTMYDLYDIRGKKMSNDEMRSSIAEEFGISDKSKISTTIGGEVALWDEDLQEMLDELVSATLDNESSDSSCL